ncbi:MAG: MFS transporter [Chloroflexi bacterium]|nr:MFS transporter [Chloroflexota bacterium]
MSSERAAVGADAFPWRILGLTLLAQWAAATGNQALTAVVPFFKSELGLSLTQTGLLVAAVQIGSASGYLPGGAIGDRLGMRTTIAGGIVGIGVLLAVASRAEQFPVALATMFCVGTMAAVALPGITVAVFQWFSPRARGTAMGVKATGVPLSGIVAATTIPSLALLVGWRNGLALLALAVLTSGIVFGLNFRERDRDVRPRGGAKPRSLDLFRNRNLMILNLFGLSLISAQFATLTYLMLYLRDVFGFDLVAAGYVLAYAQAVGMASRIGWGVVSDQVFGGARKPVIVAAGVIGSIASLLLGLVTPEQPTVLLVVAATLLGVSAIGWNSIYQIAIPELVRPEQAGAAVGLSFTLTSSAAIVGPPLFGLIVDTSGSYASAWLALAGVCAALTIIAAIFLRERKLDPR